MRQHFIIRDRVISFEEPIIMGILNVTPDSFSDGGRYSNLDRACNHAMEMIEQGAKIIDIGGESTRPGSEAVSTDEELYRVIPVAERLMDDIPEHIMLSIDTTKYEVARECLDLGVHWINDVSGLTKEPRFVELAAEANAGLMIMHSQGEPKSMQQNPSYQDVVSEVYDHLIQRANYASSADVPCVVIDPGLGFGKTLEHNLLLLRNIPKFVSSGYPVLVGASRKSMIGSVLGGRPVDERLAGSLAVHYDALLKGARIIRVHDVQESADAMRIFTAINS